MSPGPDAHDPKYETHGSDNGGDEISKHIEFSREISKLTNEAKQLEKRAAVAEKEAKELREALTETEGGGNGLGGRGSTENLEKQQHVVKKNRKARKKEAIDLERGKFDARMIELDQDRRQLNDEKQALEDAKQTLRKRERRLLLQVLYIFTKLKLNSISSDIHEEAASVSDAASSYIDEGTDLTTGTKPDMHERSLDEEIQMAYSSESEDDGQCIGCITPVLPVAGQIDTASTGSPVTGSPVTGSPVTGFANLTQRGCQREKFRSHGTEVETALRTGMPEQIELTPIVKARGGGVLCEANERSARHRFPALYPRLLAWLLCVVLLAVGIGMTITACLYIEKAEREQNLWFEANGLTRAYLLAKAPTGDVD